MKYKAGDKVRIKSLDWYNENKDEYGNIDINDNFTFYADRSKYCGKVFTISEVFDNCYGVKEDNNEYLWIDEMIEGLVEESDDFEKMYMESEKRYEEEYSIGEYCHEQSFKWGFQEGYDYAHENDKLEISLKDGYQFVDENGNVINATKIVLEKKKKEYPKTFKECQDYLGEDVAPMVEPISKTHRRKSVHLLEILLTCRDAYWKIAGEEMGLGKPWEPDWSFYEPKFCLGTDKDKVKEECVTTGNRILAFPTEEMRDAFYENFKELIEQCKELL